MGTFFLVASLATLVLGIMRYYQGKHDRDKKDDPFELILVVKWALEEVDVLKGIHRLGLRYYVAICILAFFALFVIRFFCIILYFFSFNISHIY